MKNQQFYKSAILAFAAILLCGMAAAQGEDVDVRLSSREAYVGMPVVLQVSINNAGDYEEPTLPNIDGCDVRSAGAPAQSSQVTIINGHRSESRSVTLQYLITPRREGSFEIPSFSINVDGRNVITQPQRFVATKSVTGDLLFVEITGEKEKVFVGQPLELTLRIWLKPYRDAERGLTLSEGDMWHMISDQTSWGGFADRIQEMAQSNQRPGGKEVLRDDGQGSERSYYLYEIKATVYPKRAGQIDARDVQIVVNYPTALGQSRSPFGDFFNNRPFGGNSPFSHMMNDDFFDSPFGNRLAVSSTRPIVGEVSVDATEVTPVPQAGRPADYRGAVGRYRIVTRATPTAVDAGDPITLNIGIAGSGPMELVQAPPLFELPALTKDFHVADESLAGFVHEDTKVFSTTIRPRQAEITEIPAIPFSFFDPETETFQTVLSEPISITVNESETLALDAIVGNSRGRGQSDPASSATTDVNLPNFTNDNSASVLIPQSPPSSVAWWWSLVVLPPCVWLALFLFQNRQGIAGRLLHLQSPRKRCLSAVESAPSSEAIIDALTQYIARATRTPCRTTSSALGQLRIRGDYEMANELDTLFQNLGRAQPGDGATQSLLANRQEARALVDKLDASFMSQANSPVRPEYSNFASRLLRRTAPVVIAAVFLATSASHGFAAETTAATVELNAQQQQTILAEAGAEYTRASELAATDSAVAKQLFAAAAGKYQLLVDAEIHNSRLYINLGNAYLQSGQLGRAIANYERARQLEPGNRQLLANLKFANSKVKGATAQEHADDDSGKPAVLNWLMRHLRSANEATVQLVGLPTVIASLVLASLTFWGLWIVRVAGVRFRVWRFAGAPLLVLLVSLSAYGLAATDNASDGNAVVVADHVRLHAGDGIQFEEVATLHDAQGQRVEVMSERGNWTQIRTAHGQIGWAQKCDIESIRSRHRGL